MAVVTDRRHNLGSLERVPLDEGREFMVGKVAVAVFRTRDGGVYAMQSRCTHKAGPLADGLVGNGKVVCPLHAYAFKLTTGEPIASDCKALKTYPVVVDGDGDMWLSLDTVQRAG